MIEIFCVFLSTGTARDKMRQINMAATPSARYLAIDLNTLINLRDLHQETLPNRHHVRFHLADSGSKGIGQGPGSSNPMDQETVKDALDAGGLAW
ncbi:hypothetical protein [Mesorhizobium carmichaelinearum]|uniref:hypothetical protein n=1 Tax=Mesorhizobium carmichaelinearum TaxID=1208188 RepID=UPI000BA4376B|nr:hypothetical protein [Mesorhizobium carmichaelinearum]